MRSVLLLLLVVLAAPAVAALGVSPASKAVEGGDEHTYTLRVINTDREQLSLRLLPDGEAGGLLTIVPSELTLAPTDAEGTVLVTVRAAGAAPGTYEGGIIVEQVPGTYAREGQVGAVAAIKHRVSIHIPPEGAFLAAEILASAGIAEEPLFLTAALRNLGTVDIPAVHGTVTIRSGSGTVATLEVPVTAVPAGATRNVVLSWTPDAAGEYTADGTFRHTGGEAASTAAFTVGTLDVELLDVSAELQGTVLRVEIPVRSNWNRDIRGVYAEVTASGPDGAARSATSPSENLGAGGEATLVAFIEGMDSPAEGTVTLHYAGRTKRLGFATREDAAEREGTPLWPLLAAAALILALIAFHVQKLIRNRR